MDIKQSAAEFALAALAYFGVVGGINLMQGYGHPEYHTPKSGVVVEGARVMYGETAPWDILNIGYEGHLTVSLPDGTGFTWHDLNNNLRADGGDGLRLYNGVGNKTDIITVKKSNPNSIDIASKLQPRIDATLEEVLRHQTAVIR